MPCEPCSADLQCGGADDLCVAAGPGTEAVCARACASSTDCDAGFGCLTVASVDGTKAKQCVPLSGSCEDPAPTCEDDGFEQNDTRAQAAAKAPLPMGDHYGLVACAGDDDWYMVTTTREGTVGVLVEGGAASNLSLGLYGEQGDVLAVSEGPTSSEVVEECLPAGTYFVRVTAFGASDNTYDMLLEHTEGSCAGTCTDDAFEDDDGFAQAVYAEVWPDPYVSTQRMICAGDDDFYEIELYTAETVAIDLTFVQTGFDEDLDLHFFDGNGTDLTPCTENDPGTCSAAQGQSATSNEHYEYTVGQAGCAPCTFYVSVHGWSGAQNEYDIQIALQ